MEWFAGNIPEAIQLAKTRGSIFIVYITGDDDATKDMDQMWEDADVSRLCKEEAAVAIKIQANSEACTFFSQIYPVVLVPSAYFIGNNGTPLEVVGGNVSSDNFKEKVTAVLEHSKSDEASVGGRQPQQPVTAVSATPQACTSRQTASAPPDQGEPDEKKTKIDIDDRVERAKDMIEKKKALKIQEEKEKERQKEVERRKLGQNVQQLKQFQQEREATEVLQQLKKDKEEERQARQRIKQQIEKDRMERNARYQKEKAEKQEEQEKARKAKLQQQQQTAAEAEARRSETARIQFRLPDGSSVSNQFPSSDPLRSAYDFVSPRCGGGKVTLSTAYPRRTFTPDDMAASFSELQLAPTAVLIVVPASGSMGGNSSGGGGGSSLLSLLFTPLLMIWNFIMSFFTSRPAVGSSGSSRAAGSAGATSAAGGDRARPSAVKRSRQDGNIRRLRDMDDDDDETATWNGNSTQQM